MLKMVPQHSNAQIPNKHHIAWKLANYKSKLQSSLKTPTKLIKHIILQEGRLFQDKWQEIISHQDLQENMLIQKSFYI